MDVRFMELTAWLGEIPGFAGTKPVPASEDASFRRYFRVNNGTSFIVMDAPPPQEDCRPFVKIADALNNIGVNCPHIIEADIERGFLLMSDLGPIQYLVELERNPHTAHALYSDAISAMQVMQRHGIASEIELPAYDEAMMRFELSIFREWLCAKHLQLEFSEKDEAQWQRCCDIIVENGQQQKQVFVHRDFHSRNLMLTQTDNPGILDFQDAVVGPLTYDLVSLLKDCYIKWPEDKIYGWANSFYAGLATKDRETLDETLFERQFDLTGVLRHLKAAGIFSRLLMRDSKPGYMKDVPRTLSYIVDLAPKYAELEFLADLISQRILPSLGKSDS